MAMVLLHDGLKGSADRSAKENHIVAAGDLSGFLRREPPAQNRRDEVNPLRVIRQAPRRNMLVGTDADMIDPDDFGHLLQTIDVFIEAPEEVPDADRAAGLCVRPRMLGAHLPLATRGLAHLPRPH